MALIILVYPSICIKLNRYPMRIIDSVVIPKKIKISCKLITLFSIIASGKLRAAIAIINDRAVPNGTPFSNKVTAIGNIAAQLPYIGTPNTVAIGTENTPVLFIKL